MAYLCSNYIPENGYLNRFFASKGKRDVYPQPVSAKFRAKKGIYFVTERER